MKVYKSTSCFNAWAGSFATGIVIDDTEWHNVMIKRDSNVLYVYLDHVLEYSNTMTGTIPTHCADFQIGTNLGLGNGLDGQMDEFAIWNRAVSENERLSIQDNGITLTDGLVGYWNFNEGSGSEVIDQTGNCENGTISGASWFEIESVLHQRIFL